LQFDRNVIAILEQIETLAHQTILMIAKGSLESVTRKKRNNAITKEKGTKGKTMIYKIPHRKLKIEQHEPH
jgi:hypothetical protein